LVFHIFPPKIPLGKLSAVRFWVTRFRTGMIVAFALMLIAALINIAESK
jgi:hypothetical protein